MLETFKINLLDRFEGHLQTTKERERMKKREKLLVHYKIILFYLFMVHLVTRGQDSAVGMAKSNRLDSERIGVRLPAGAENSFLLQSVQTESWPHPISCLMGTEGSFSWGNSARTCSWLSQSNAKVKNAWIYTSNPSYLSMAWYLIN
jgi:hypothetical protein